MQAQTTPNQGKTSVNTLQTQSVKSSVTKSMDIQAPTRPVGPFASSLKATEKDLLQKSSIGHDPTHHGSPDATENNGKSTLAKSDRLASSSGKGSKKKPPAEPKKAKANGRSAPAQAASTPSGGAKANTTKKSEGLTGQKTEGRDSVDKQTPHAHEKATKGGKKTTKEQADQEMKPQGGSSTQKRNGKEAQRPAKAEESSKARARIQTVTKEEQDKSTKKDGQNQPNGKPSPEEKDQTESEEEFDEDMDEEDEQEDDEELEDEGMDEDAEDEVEEHAGEEESVSQLRLRPNREFYLAEKRIANRALRIKMGKSGAQAATRKNIKKGKDACQRKLWNQGVSTVHLFYYDRSLKFKFGKY